jgi:hypothetical protein
VDGPSIDFYGLPFSTRMTVVRLADGGLWVHSPIPLEGALAAELAALGPVQALVAPNWIHYYYLPQWQARFPSAQTWAAPGVQARAAKAGLTIRGGPYAGRGGGGGGVERRDRGAVGRGELGAS